MLLSFIANELFTMFWQCELNFSLAFRVIYFISFFLFFFFFFFFLAGHIIVADSYFRNFFLD